MNRIFHARIAVGQYLFLVLTTIIVIYAMWMQHAVMAILFMLLLIIAIGVVVFALRWGVASMFTSGALIYALFAGLGAALGMNTLVIVFIGYMGVQCWPFGAYNATLMAGLGAVNGYVEFNKIQKLTFVYSALVIVAALVNLPIWKLIGLC